MKKLILIATLALGLSPALPALAVPMCDGPPVVGFDSKGQPKYDEIGSAQDAEDQLRGMGIDAHNTRWWNGCLQTFVTIDGHSVMKFYNPDSYAEIPVN